MVPNSLELPAGPQAARIFFGYRAAKLTEAPTDTESDRLKKRKDFFGDLGSTFMPGTPLMQAPLGLGAYVPAVIDPPAGAGLPDEVAIIVYASLDIYNRFRETSLSRRMYTKSHDAVFNMPVSIAQFPGTLDKPANRTVGADVQHFLYLTDTPVDWQAGHTRVALLVPAAPSADFASAMLVKLRAARELIDGAGIDQILAGIAPGFAALWIHSDQPFEDPLGRLDLLPEGARIFRDLPATPAPVVGDSERGVTISGASAFTFRFSRNMEFFVSRPAPESAA